MYVAAGNLEESQKRKNCWAHPTKNRRNVSSGGSRIFGKGDGRQFG